jgi:hypothetical protein
MQSRLLLCGPIVAMLLASCPLGATTASSLGSFDGIEEPLVRYTPSTGAFVTDDFVNITDLGDGAFRMRLRYRSDVWDGDRDTENKDRQRAEVKGLGRHQKTGETFEYATTWRSSPGFRGASRFCHIFQLKSTNGDSGAPVVTLSIDEGRQTASVRYWSGHAKDSTVARDFPWTPNTWQTVRIRITTSPENAATGAVIASVNGDDFQGARNIPVFRTGASDYRPKWGLYRAAKPGLSMGDDFIEHRAISANPLAEGSLPAQTAGAVDRENYAALFGQLKTQPRSPARNEQLATVAAEWATQDPPAAMKAVAQLDSNDGRPDARQRVFNRWADRDSAAVLEWAKHQPPSVDLDNLLWYFATDTTLRYVRRPLALEGAAIIADRSLRAQALEHVVLIWARSEPAQAARYVRESGALTDEQKKTLLEKIDVRRKS